eukprot:COSAG02_NODE_4760_length_5017_cov_7.215331_2_plen_40_part_00
MVQQERNAMINGSNLNEDDEARKAAGFAVIDLFAGMFAQ